MWLRKKPTSAETPAFELFLTFLGQAADSVSGQGKRNLWTITEKKS
jgi:hypothetical protein